MTVPFRALNDGKIVTPTQVEDRQAVECPECRGVLYPRDGKHRARHFFHASDTAEESCSTASGGESETHARCMALAVTALDTQFPDASHTGAEVPIDVTGTATTPDSRRADALVEFEAENVYFGNGLIIEVQYKHRSKDIEGTTHDYLSAGYSVAWLTPDDFEAEQLQYNVVDQAFRAEDGDGYSIREHDPSEFETSTETALSWEKQKKGCQMVDEVGSHTWTRIPAYAHPQGYEYEYCWWCGSRRQYNQKRGRYVYDHQGVLTPNVPSDALRHAVIPHPPGTEDFDRWSASEHHGGPVAFEKSLVSRDDVAPCRGPRGVHEWDTVEVIERDISDHVEVVLWECKHCPVHLLTNFSCHGEIEPYILFGVAPNPEWGLSHLNENPRSCQNRSHLEADWDYYPDCFQNNP